ncbi:MAG TPA: hypothetical protein VFD07_05625 [Candidatus Krumholzibacteria bacterium]|jgi:hypothetical protein|nr:hypothetical protein [Candidatus Krumholzibacteria bacterium]
MRTLIGILLLLCIAWCVARAGDTRRIAREPPRRFPVARLSGAVPALWIFVRDDCGHCEEHLRALARALDGLPPPLRQRAEARLHVVGDAPFASPVERHPASTLDALGIGPTPLTWWVAADTSIARAWRGARDVDAWRRALAFVLAEDR